MSKKQASDKPPKRKINPAMKYSGMAAQMTGSAVLGFFGGRWLDNYFGLEKPLFAMALLILFLSAFMFKLIRDVSQDK